MEGLIMLASTGAFIWLLYRLATRGQRRARKATGSGSDHERRLTDVERVVAYQDERLNAIEQHLADQPPLRRVQ